MRLTRNVKAISKLLFVLLLLTALVVGAILSYLWIIGYYLSLDLVNPEDITVNITDYAFDCQDTSFFNVTIQCPTSYKSEETADITRIAVSTEDGVLHDKIGTDPLLPYKFQKKGKSQTFKCLWNWANYTGETIKIIAFVAKGSGPTFEAETPLVDLSIADVRFNPAISVTHFNMTAKNSPSSVTYVNITRVTIDNKLIPPKNLSISLPYPLNPDETVSLICTWNWINYQNKSVTVAVHTLQGYMANYSKTTPLPVILEISEVLFDITDTNPYFNVTVQMRARASPTYVDVTEIVATVENGVPLDVTEITPSLPYRLSSGESKVFMCFCSWTGYRNKNVNITVHTLQGFKTPPYTQVTPAPVILKVTEVQFDPTNATRLNITVSNSRISLMDVNITHITVTLENGNPENITEITPSLPYLLHTNELKTFACTWNWTDYGGINATFTAYAVGYSASITKLVPEPVIVITDVVFDPADPTHFNVTVKNPPLSLMVANVTNITVTVEEGNPENITKTRPPLPREVDYTEVTFTCSWNWTDHLGKKVTIAVVTLQGYATSYTRSIPLIALINITNVAFNITDITHFNVTILNPESSPTYAHLMNITATLEDGADQNVTVVGPPYLPHILHRNQSITFVCLWNWSEYCDRNVIITVSTLQGYVAYYTQHTPPPIIIEVTNVLFDIANTTYFNITVQNSKYSLVAANVTRISVTVENETFPDIQVLFPHDIPYEINPGANVTFKCSWNWTGYRDKNATITVYTLQGYRAYYNQVTPPPVILTITYVHFDEADTNHFNFTVHNSEFSLLVANITRITVTMENETIENITDVVPSLPYVLSQNFSVTFTCTWNWTDYRSKSLTITVYTLEGYKTLILHITP